ncbi:hypothetical protein B0H16DRAFT_1483205 [Mycena metata]|uniref:Uncharacterized protein n=1 Tax=Mycena metata TaxID=1033252 RepID=A0AAD7GQ49_9AGAR|nr:hypothetical protein B0H16DRAFT_1483205 [Mycena metata]
MYWLNDADEERAGEYTLISTAQLHVPHRGLWLCCHSTFSPTLLLDGGVLRRFGGRAEALCNIAEVVRSSQDLGGTPSVGRHCTSLQGQSPSAGNAVTPRSGLDDVPSIQMQRPSGDAMQRPSGDAVSRVKPAEPTVALSRFPSSSPVILPSAPFSGLNVSVAPAASPATLLLHPPHRPRAPWARAQPFSFLVAGDLALGAFFCPERCCCTRRIARVRRGPALSCFPSSSPVILPSALFFALNAAVAPAASPACAVGPRSAFSSSSLHPLPNMLRYSEHATVRAARTASYSLTIHSPRHRLADDHPSFLRADPSDFSAFFWNFGGLDEYLPRETDPSADFGPDHRGLSSTFESTTSTSNSAFPHWTQPSSGLGGRGMKQKVSDAQRAASSRYRERNKAELQRKARQRMATRRAELKMNDEAWAVYRATAREDGARFRARHAPDLALNQVTYRSSKSIAKIGHEAWWKGYLKRHPRPPPVQEEDLPDWPSDSDSEHDPLPEPSDSEGDAQDDDTPKLPPRPPESAPYEECLNHFLDYEDPTTAPNYVPKPGQQPFFQLGWEDNCYYQYYKHLKTRTKKPRAGNVPQIGALAKRLRELKGTRATPTHLVQGVRATLFGANTTSDRLDLLQRKLGLLNGGIRRPFEFFESVRVRDAAVVGRRRPRVLHRLSLDVSGSPDAGVVGGSGVSPLQKPSGGRVELSW